MNGVSLLVAFAALGVEAGWETGSDGQSIYTIKIEPVLVEPLRNQQAVVSTVDVKDAGLRRFRIVMGTPQAGADVPSRRSRDETMVQHGWRIGDDGGLDYLVQLSPERLETLGQGVPITTEVHASVPEIRRFYIFSGLSELPRTGLPEPKLTENRPPDFLNVGGGTTSPPSPPELSRPQVGAPRSDEQFDPRNRSATENGFPLGADAPRAGDRNEGWRYERDSEAKRGGFSLGSDERNPWPSGQRDQRDTRPIQYVNEGRGPGGYADREDRFPQRSPEPRVNAPPPAEPPPAQPVSSYSQRPVSETPTAPAQTAVTQAAAQQPAPQQPPNWAANPNQAPYPYWTQPPPPGKDEPKPEESSVPLLLTTLALFASIGANAYLGWLAWSFFWRYRNSATDIARFRTLGAASRQAA